MLYGALTGSRSNMILRALLELMRFRATGNLKMSLLKFGSDYMGPRRTEMKDL